MTRWVICDALPDGKPAVAEFAHAFRHRRELPDGRLLVECEFEADGPQLDRAQQDARLLVLPSLTAPADRLPAAVQSRLAAMGVTPAAGDTVLNLLRALRGKLGARFRVDLDS